MIKKHSPAVYEVEEKGGTISGEEKKLCKEGGRVSRFGHNLLKKVYGMVLLLFVGLAAVLFIQNKIGDNEKQKMEKRIADLESELDSQEKKKYERVEIDTVQIVKDLKEASDLTTYTYEYTNKTTESSTRILPILDWDIPGTTSNVTILYSGVINVGYDMGEIDYELSKEEPVIYVTLPEPEVLDNYIKFDDLRCICDNNILNPIKTDAVMAYFNTIEQDELKKAEADDIYNKADGQLQEIVKRYFKVIPEYEVEFRSHSS